MRRKLTDDNVRGFGQGSTRYFMQPSLPTQCDFVLPEWNPPAVSTPASSGHSAAGSRFPSKPLSSVPFLRELHRCGFESHRREHLPRGSGSTTKAASPIYQNMSERGLDHECHDMWFGIQCSKLVRNEVQARHIPLLAVEMRRAE